MNDMRDVSLSLSEILSWHCSSNVSLSSIMVKSSKLFFSLLRTNFPETKLYFHLPPFGFFFLAGGFRLIGLLLGLFILFFPPMTCLISNGWSSPLDPSTGVLPSRLIGRLTPGMSPAPCFAQADSTLPISDRLPPSSMKLRPCSARTARSFRSRSVSACLVSGSSSSESPRPGVSSSVSSASISVRSRLSKSNISSYGAEVTHELSAVVDTSSLAISSTIAISHSSKSTLLHTESIRSPSLILLVEEGVLSSKCAVDFVDGLSLVLRDDK